MPHLPWFPLIALLMVVLALGFFASRRRPGGAEASYRQTPLMNRTEAQFYAQLQRTVPPGQLAFAQVQLARFVEAEATNPKRNWAALNAIVRLSVDFLVVDAATMLPKMAIEIDGPTHRAARQRSADRRKNHALKSAGVALLRVPADKPLTTAMLSAHLNSK